MIGARPAKGVLAASLRGRRTHLLLALGAFLLLLAVRDPHYFTVDNLRVIGLNASSVGIASIGTAFLMIAAGIDLSIGMIFVAAGFMAAELSLHTSTPVAIVAGLVLAGVLGGINGAVVWRIRVSPIIVTLGSLTLMQGIVTVLSSGQGISGVPQSFLTFGQATPLGVPIEIWVVAGLAVIGAIVLSQTTIGAHVYALGGNRDASELAGVRVRRLSIGLFVVAGLAAGLAGIMTSARFGVADFQFGVDFNLDVITAVILGGVAFTGGEGTIGGVILAVIFLNVVDSGLIALGVAPSYSDVIKGSALIISVGLEQLTQERNERLRRSIAIAEMAALDAEQAAAGSADAPLVTTQAESGERA